MERNRKQLRGINWLYYEESSHPLIHIYLGNKTRIRDNKIRYSGIKIRIRDLLTCLKWTESD